MLDAGCWMLDACFVTEEVGHGDGIGFGIGDGEGEGEEEGGCDSCLTNVPDNNHVMLVGECKASNWDRG